MSKNFNTSNALRSLESIQEKLNKIRQGLDQCDTIDGSRMPLNFSSFVFDTLKMAETAVEVAQKEIDRLTY